MHLCWCTHFEASSIYRCAANRQKELSSPQQYFQLNSQLDAGVVLLVLHVQTHQSQGSVEEDGVYSQGLLICPFRLRISCKVRNVRFQGGGMMGVGSKTGWVGRCLMVADKRMKKKKKLNARRPLFFLQLQSGRTNRWPAARLKTSSSPS